MKIYSELTPAVDRRERGVAIGTFDGVHLGHQELLKRLVLTCRRSGLVPTVFTFSDHPEMIFGTPGQFPGYLMDERDRLAAFEATGIEEVFLLPLVPEIYELSAEHFLNRWLLTRLNAKLIAVGKDASFGAGKTGGTAFLHDWCDRNGVTALVVDDVFLDGEKVSSTRIRQALKAKEVELANRMLVHPYRLSGSVEKGRNLGSQHGIPTANFSEPGTRLSLPHGVYASRVEVDGRWYDAISNIGVSPTIDPEDRHVRVESFLFDYEADMYDKPIRVDILKFIRQEAVYESFKAMLPQIEDDIRQTKQFHLETEQPVVRFESGGIPVVALKTNRFQIGHAAILFRLRAVKKRMPALAVLLHLMTRRTKTYPVPARLEQALAGLGDASLSPVLMQEGDVQVLGLQAAAPESDFAERHLSGVIRLMLEAVSDVFFDWNDATFAEWFEREKTQLIDLRMSEDEDKIEQAVRLTIETVLAGQPHSYHMLGEVSDLEQVSADDLREAHRWLMQDAYAAFYVSGNLTNALLDEIDAALSVLPSGDRPRLIDTWPLDPVLRAQPDRVFHTNTTQHIVILAIRNGSLWYETDRWADYLFADMLGGGQHSRLFRELRDKEALGYQIFMIPFNIIGISLLVAATTAAAADAVKSGFRREIEHLANNAFSDELLNMSRRYLENAVTSAWDHARARLFSAVSWHIYGYSGQLADKLAFIRSVEREDAVRMANGATPLLFFELAGEQ